MKRFHSNGDWGLIPGPATFKEPLYSSDLEEIAEYSPEEIAGALISIPGISLRHGNSPDWWEWRAEYNAPDESITFAMTLFDTQPPSFGGLSLIADCYAGTLLSLWTSLRRACPAIWLHAPDCRVYSPASFEKEQG